MNTLAVCVLCLLTSQTDFGTTCDAGNAISFSTMVSQIVGRNDGPSFSAFCLFIFGMSASCATLHGTCVDIAVSARFVQMLHGATPCTSACETRAAVNLLNSASLIAASEEMIQQRYESENGKKNTLLEYCACAPPLTSD